MNIKIQKLHPDAIVPSYATPGAACFDLHAATVNGNAHLGDVVYPGHPLHCDTGLAFEIPAGHVMLIRSRSGLAFRAGVRAFHGTIDSDYRGSVVVMLTCNHLDDDAPPVRINPGDRIAQAMVIACPTVCFELVEALDATERGDGGFGSTGI
jgi:dUTP pyrophosphatase